MLEESEKTKCRSILELLPAVDILALVDTVTKKSIKPSNNREAIKIVLDYSSNALELLRRQKVKRDILFQYLVGKGVRISPSADKNVLIAEILKEGDDDNDLVLLDTPTKQGRRTVNEPARPSTQNVLIDHSTKYNIHIQQHIHSPEATAQTTVNISPGSSHQVHQDNVHQTNIQAQTDPTLQTLGEKFAEWFYGIINSYNPDKVGAPQDFGPQGAPQDFGPQHFWDDVALIVITPTKSQEFYNGPAAVAQCFLSYTKNEHLLFNPNISPSGVSVKSSPFGLVAVMVLGTVHKGSECLGLFQQLFGLIKDPRLDNNWKIKRSKLEVICAAVHNPPVLPSNTDRQLLEVM